MSFSAPSVLVDNCCLGWTPSTFTSSRNARAQPQKTAFRPEDFMDDEDMADRRENQNMVDEADEMIISRPTLSADNTSEYVPS